MHSLHSSTVPLLTFFSNSDAQSLLSHVYILVEDKLVLILPSSTGNTIFDVLVEFWANVKTIIIQ